MKLKDGAIIIVEDKNKTIVRLSTGKSLSELAPPSDGVKTKVWTEAELDLLLKLRESYFRPICSSFHTEVFDTKFTTQKVVSEFYERDFIESQPFTKSKLFMRLDPQSKKVLPQGWRMELTDEGRIQIIKIMTKILEVP